MGINIHNQSRANIKAQMRVRLERTRSFDNGLYDKDWRSGQVSTKSVAEAREARFRDGFTSSALFEKVVSADGAVEITEIEYGCFQKPQMRVLQKTSDGKISACYLAVKSSSGEGKSSYSMDPMPNPRQEFIIADSRFQ